MRGKVMVLVGAAVIGLSACGASGGGSKDYSSAADLAKAAGCNGYAKDGEPEMFVQEQGNCQIGGQDVTVYVFADDAARDNWVKVAKTMGASGYMGEGSKWVLTSDDKAAVEKGAKAAGGELTT